MPWGKFLAIIAWLLAWTLAILALVGYFALILEGHLRDIAEYLCFAAAAALFVIIILLRRFVRREEL